MGLLTSEQHLLVQVVPDVCTGQTTQGGTAPIGMEPDAQVPRHHLLQQRLGVALVGSRLEHVFLHAWEQFMAALSHKLSKDTALNSERQVL